MRTSNSMCIYICVCLFCVFVYVLCELCVNPCNLYILGDIAAIAGKLHFVIV